MGQLKISFSEQIDTPAGVGSDVHAEVPGAMNVSFSSEPGLSPVGFNIIWFSFLVLYISNCL